MQQMMFACKAAISCLLLVVVCCQEEDSRYEENDSSLADNLLRLQFKSSGTVYSTDEFRYRPHPMTYLEPDNVTTLRHAWQAFGHYSLLYKKLDNGTLVSPPLGMRSAVPLGGISTGFIELRADGSFHEWTIMNQTPGGAAKIPIFDDAFLAVSWRITNRASSGTDSENLKFKPRKPRRGVDEKMTIDLFEDFILNHKQKSAKPKTSGLLALRTHPSENMKAAKIDGVRALEYSGAHPVSRLRVLDDRLPFNLTVFAFSTYSVHNMTFSATPVVRFVPLVHNPSGSDYEVSLHLVLPRGIEPRTQRVVQAMVHESQKVHVYNNTASDLDCFNLCNVKSPLVCKSWTYNASASQCRIYDTINLNAFNDGASSGLRSSWTTDSRGSVACVSHVTPGDAPPSGNMSMCAPSEGSPALHVFDNLTQWKPSLKKSKMPQSGVNVVGVFGAVKAGDMEIHKGKTDVLNPIVLSWFYPTKDFQTYLYGNMYTQLFDDSLDAADYGFSATAEALDDIVALNDVFYNSSLPEFIQDVLYNSISHIRSAMWIKDNRWRQWEAYDCTNIDSVHNDGERHIPYIMFLPESTKNKVLAWGKSQLPNGMIPEQLHSGCGNIWAGKLDTPSGRTMSDVSSMFIVYVYELYTWGNEVEFTKGMWPFVKKAAQWHMDRAKETGSIKNMVTTYDVLSLVAYTYSAYSTAFHLLAMRAAEELAIVMGDVTFAEQCSAAYLRGQDVLDNVQWNTTAGYYNAYTQVGKAESVYREFNHKFGRMMEVDANKSPAGAIMTDSFYSQVLAYSTGLGLLLKDAEKLKSHLKSEYRINKTPYGMLVMTGRYPYPGPGQDNAVWQMGNPNWAALNIHLGEDVDNALQVAAVTLEAWRSKVNDLWNCAGITGGIGYGAEGLPYGTSHYGYYMSSWHIILALTGQQANLPGKTLTFDPKAKAPYRYPILLAGTVGVLSATNGEYSVCVVIGRSVSLSTISVSGSRCPSVPWSMEPGDCVSWKM